jgi:thioredoxin 1
MSKGNATNILAIFVVVAVIAGAAWLKSQRARTPEAGIGQAGSPAPARPADQPTDASIPAVAEGELCPEGVPASQPGLVAAPTQPAAEVKLPRLVDLGAGKCKACKALAPILDALREEYKGRLSVEFIDVWKDPAAGRPYCIRLIPTQILYDRDGNEVWRHEGFISKENLKALFAEKVGVQ